MIRSCAKRPKGSFVRPAPVKTLGRFFLNYPGVNQEFIFPDLNNTNSKMFIHPSKWRFSTRDGHDGIDRAVKEVRQLAGLLGISQYLLAMNTIYATQLKKDLKDLPNIRVDYYKSSDSIGSLSGCQNLHSPGSRRVAKARL